jgi:hypothetical protein
MIEAKRGGGQYSPKGPDRLWVRCAGVVKMATYLVRPIRRDGQLRAARLAHHGRVEPGRQFGRLHALRDTRTARGQRSPGIAERAQGIACQPLAPDKRASCSSEYPGLTGTDIDPRHQDGLAVPWPHPSVEITAAVVWSMAAPVAAGPGGA